MMHPFGGGEWVEEVGETTLCDQVKVELLSLTWLFGAHHLCGEPLFITQWLKTFLAYGSEFHPSLLFIRSSKNQIGRAHV